MGIICGVNVHIIRKGAVLFFSVCAFTKSVEINVDVQKGF